MKKSKFVTSYFCTLSPIGVYSLTFNLTERGLNYHAYNDTMFVFGSEDGETQEEWELKIQEIPEFLPKIEKGMFLSASMINKDQVTFYYIPYYFEYIQKGLEKTIIKETYN